MKLEEGKASRVAAKKKDFRSGKNLHRNPPEIIDEPGEKNYW